MQLKRSIDSMAHSSSVVKAGECVWIINSFHSGFRTLWSWQQCKCEPNLMPAYLPSHQSVSSAKCKQSIKQNIKTHFFEQNKISEQCKYKLSLMPGYHPSDQSGGLALSSFEFIRVCVSWCYCNPWWSNILLRTFHFKYATTFQYIVLPPFNIAVEQYPQNISL